MDAGSAGGFASGVELFARKFFLGIIGALTISMACAGFPHLSQAQSSICAEVKIEIYQQVSLERQAFDAVLKIRNGLEGVQVEDIDVNLVFKDGDGDNASALFFSSLGTTSGIVGSFPGATVPASTTGEAHWLIIPSPGAGGTSPAGVMYQVGATITYRMTGETTPRTVEVIPETITVRPQPLLDLDYFLPGDVYADDALTPETEPPIPFTLGVRITNSGAGTAANTRIESAQPQVVDNEQGLLIGFLIEGSYVDDQPSQPSLLIDFGDIDPGVSRMGRWIMTTTLSGQFFDFSAEYTHADELGGELTSLIGTVTPYRLTRDVQVDLAGRDNVRDFLAQAAESTQDSDPYRVYESDGPVSEVVQQFSPTFSGSTLSFPSLSEGLLIYARAPISFDGQGMPISATRSDGKVVPPANVWFSKRRDTSGEEWLYYLNLFEAESSECSNGVCSYHLDYEGAPPEGSIAGLVYEDVNANGTQDVDEPGLSGIVVTLSNGGTPQSVDTDTGGAFQFAGLPAGTYALAVGPLAGYYDGMAVAGSAGGTAGTSSIDGIVLDADTQATGYLFAKVPEPPQLVADLAISALTATPSSPRAGEIFALTLQVANAGPDTAGVDAALGLPPNLEVLSANPSMGTFDAETGFWAVGDLAATAAATLVVQVRASSPGELLVTASVASSDPSVLDPESVNNNTTLPVVVQPATDVDVTATFARESRVLALVSCSLRTGGASDPCESHQILLDAYLTGRSIDHRVTASATTFRDELRSGRWNVYWIHNGSQKLDEGVLAEVGLAVLRGDSLIVDGNHDASSVMVDEWAGVSYLGVHGSIADEPVTFVPNDYLSFTGLVVSGRKHSYQVNSGLSLAHYPDNEPAIVFGSHGAGRVLLFSYDLVASLTGDVAYDPLFDQIVAATQPVVPASFTADSYVPVALQLVNEGDIVSVDETFVVPVDARIVKAVPDPTQSDSQHATWRSDLEVDATFDSSVGLRSPAGGTSLLGVDVIEVDGENLAHQELTLVVRNTDDQADLVEDLILLLPITDSDDGDLRDQAISALGEAVDARLVGAFNDALAYLLSASTALEQIDSADTSTVRIELAWLLQAFEREWYSALPECSANSLPPIQNDGMSFVPFANSEGLYLHQIDTGGFEWRLGADTQSTTASVGASLALANSQVYEWSVFYDGAGNGALTLYSEWTSTEIPYVSSGTNVLHTGNGIRLRVEALEPPSGTASTSISVVTTDIEGTGYSDAIDVMATSAASSDSIYYYGEGLADGFDLYGTVSVMVPPWFGAPPPRLSFFLNAGTLGCENSER